MVDKIPEPKQESLYIKSLRVSSNPEGLGGRGPRRAERRRTVVFDAVRADGLAARFNVREELRSVEEPEFSVILDAVYYPTYDRNQDAEFFEQKRFCDFVARRVEGKISWLFSRLTRCMGIERIEPAEAISSVGGSTSST